MTIHTRFGQVEIEAYHIYRVFVIIIGITRKPNSFSRVLCGDTPKHFWSIFWNRSKKNQVRSAYFGEHERQKLIFRIFFWNWMLAFHSKVEQVLRPIGVLKRSRRLRNSTEIKHRFYFSSVVLGVAVPRAMPAKATGTPLTPSSSSSSSSC